MQLQQQGVGRRCGTVTSSHLPSRPSSYILVPHIPAATPNPSPTRTLLLLAAVSTQSSSLDVVCSLLSPRLVLVPPVPLPHSPLRL